MVTPVRRQTAPPNRGKKYLFLIVAVFSIILIHNHTSKTPKEQKDKPSDSTPNLRKPETEAEKHSTNLLEKIDNLNKFEEQFEKEEEEREHLDNTINDVKEDLDIAEEEMVEEKEIELAELLDTKRVKIEDQIRDYLKDNKVDPDPQEIDAIIDQLNSRIDEKVKKELRIEAEKITIEKENEVEAVVLEDVIDGMDNSLIEVDVMELEENLLEDLMDEITELSKNLEDKVDEAIEETEEELLKELDVHSDKSVNEEEKAEKNDEVVEESDEDDVESEKTVVEEESDDNDVESEETVVEEESDDNDVESEKTVVEEESDDDDNVDNDISEEIVGDENMEDEEEK